MRAEDLSRESVLEEAVTERGTWFPLSQRGRDILKAVLAVALAFGVWWWIVFSSLSGLEKRLIDRMDLNHRELSAQLEGLERGQGVLLAGQAALPALSAQIERLERSMAEGFKQSHLRMDRIEGRLVRIESDIDQIESNIDRFESNVDANE